MYNFEICKCTLEGLEEIFYKLIPTANDQQKIMITDAGHFLREENGKEIANHIDSFIKGELKVSL